MPRRQNKRNKRVAMKSASNRKPTHLQRESRKLAREKDMYSMLVEQARRKYNLPDHIPYEQFPPPDPEAQARMDARLNDIFNRLRRAHMLDERERMLAMCDSPYAP